MNLLGRRRLTVMRRVLKQERHRRSRSRSDDRRTSVPEVTPRAANADKVAALLMKIDDLVG
jgi:hypothetical protein